MLLRLNAYAVGGDAILKNVVIYFVVLAIAGFACWLGFLILSGFVDGLRSLCKGIVGSLKNFSARRVERKRQLLLEREERTKQLLLEREERTKQAEQQEMADFRRRNSVQIAGLPDFDLLKRTINQLDIFIAAANSYRPQFTSLYDDRFRTTNFSYPFEFFFPRNNNSDDGPDPEPFQITLDSLAIPDGRELQPIYNGLPSASEFPAKEPSIIWDPPPAPQQPNATLPAWAIKIISSEDGSEIDVHADILTRVYAAEIAQRDALQHRAAALQLEFKKKLEEAHEAHDMMELFIANENLKFRDLKQSISAEYQARKKRFEQQAVTDLRPIRDTYKSYLLGTKEGVEEHFSLGLQTLRLPLPSGYPWRVFYASDERLRSASATTTRII